MTPEGEVSGRCAGVIHTGIYISIYPSRELAPPGGNPRRLVYYELCELCLLTFWSVVCVVLAG